MTACGNTPPVRQATVGDMAGEIAARFGLRVLGTAACPECGRVCEQYQILGSVQYDCPGCIAVRSSRRREEERRADCLRVWLDICPVNMQSPLRQTALAPWLVPALTLDGRAGAGFAGAAGGGKTRFCYHLLRLAAGRGLKPWAVTASRYRQAAADRFDHHPAVRGEARAILESARHAGALLLDDVGKGASSPSGDEALFELLDYRRNHQRVTFWTANGGSQWLTSRLGPDFGPAIVRRLLDLTGWAGKGTGRLFVAPASSRAVRGTFPRETNGHL